MMSFLRIRKAHVEAIKGISRIIVFLLKKCWLQVSLLTGFILFMWGFYGGLLALFSGIMGALLVVYKMGDWFIYHPEDPIDSRLNVASPSILRLPFESVFIQTADGVTINVVLVKQDPIEKMSSVPTIIYLHGNAGNIGHRLQNVNEMYHYLGVNILLVEYRGYGLSKGSPSESGLYLDGEAALHFLLQHPQIDKNQLILFGRSLGGAVAIDLVRNSSLSPHVAGIIIENTFTSIPDIGRILFDCRLVRMIPRWFYKNRFESLNKIPRISVPILFLSGLQDELIPPAMMSLLYSNSTSSVFKQFHSFEAGTHNFTWRCADYYDVMGKFLLKVLTSKNSPSSMINHYTISTRHSETSSPKSTVAAAVEKLQLLQQNQQISSQNGQKKSVRFSSSPPIRTSADGLIHTNDHLILDSDDHLMSHHLHHNTSSDDDPLGISIGYYGSHSPPVISTSSSTTLQPQLISVTAAPSISGIISSSSPTSSASSIHLMGDHQQVLYSHHSHPASAHPDVISGHNSHVQNHLDSNGSRRVFSTQASVASPTTDYSSSYADQRSSSADSHLIMSDGDGQLTGSSSLSSSVAKSSGLFTNIESI